MITIIQDYMVEISHTFLLQHKLIDGPVKRVEHSSSDIQAVKSFSSAWPSL